MYNVELRSMFMHFDPHPTSNHREVAKEINGHFVIFAKRRFRDKNVKNSDIKKENKSKCSTFAKYNFKIHLCKSMQAYLKG